MYKKKPSYRKKTIEKIRLEWYDLDLTNKILLFIGLILLFELIFSIFIRTINMDASTDAFFRISFSSVMGYFLGCTSSAPPSSSTILNEQKANEQTELRTLNLSTDAEKRFENMAHIRTLFIAFVCFVCIITLTITTFSNQTEYEYIEGLIQLRNIISTTIGFFISKANSRSKY